MADLRPTTWSLTETTSGDLTVSIDASNDDTIVIEQGDDTVVWVHPSDIDRFIDALREAKAQTA